MVLDRGWTWTDFQKIGTGTGSQIMTVRSFLVSSEHRSGLDHDWSHVWPDMTGSDCNIFFKLADRSEKIFVVLMWLGLQYSKHIKNLVV